MAMNPKLLRPRASGEAPVFSPLAVLLTSDTTYSVPAGATSMKAWAVGSGGVGYATDVSYNEGAGGAGGCAYKTWAVSGGDTVTYAIGAAKAETVSSAGQSTTVTYSGTTITGSGGGVPSGGSFSGGDGGADGGTGQNGSWGEVGEAGGAVGGDDVYASGCGRRRPVDVSGLFAALNAAGVSTTFTCDAIASFGSGGADDKFGPVSSAGLGGGGVQGPRFFGGLVGTPSGAGAVVLYFT